MDKKEIQEALKKARGNSAKKKFTQGVDFIVNLRRLDLKKPEEKVDFYIHFNKFVGADRKVCALVGGELFDQAKTACDMAIIVDDFPKYDKKAIKKLADEYEFFIAQANIMPKVAQSFGRVLGPRAKMPNPKAGCVVPPNANLKVLVDRLKGTMRIITKNDQFVMSSVGNETMDDSDLADNILSIYNTLIHTLPSEKENVKSLIVKLTMGKPVQIGAKAKPEEETTGKKEKKKDAPKDEASEKEGEKKEEAPKEEKKAEEKKEETPKEKPAKEKPVKEEKKPEAEKGGDE
ncbi:50S ribosomal protein L1 [Nanoarchaeota archaeon]